MIRTFLSIALLILPGAALADWSTVSVTSGGGSSTVTERVGHNQCVFETHRGVGQGAFLRAPIAPVYAELDANVYGTDVGDVDVEIRRCPPGTTTYSENVCNITYYKDKDGAVQSTLDGTGANGTDAVYGMRSPLYMVNVTSYPEQTSGVVTIVATAAADGGSTTTLIDSGESWADDQWNGYRIKNVTESITCEIFDTVNSTQTIEVVASCTDWEDPTGDTYEILDGTGTLTDTSEDWSDNEWNGDVVRNLTTGETRTIADTDGTLESITLSAPWDTAPEAGDEYDILDSTRMAEVRVCVDAR
jgi:hypothetical protein